MNNNKSKNKKLGQEEDEIIVPSDTLENNNLAKQYNFDYIVIRDHSLVKLISNLESKLSSEEAKNKYNCDFIISAGFYTQDYQHIGLFIEEGKRLSNSIKSDFYNGYLNYNKLWNISYEPSENSFFSLQTGPLLITNNRSNNLSIKDDKYSRRIISGISRNGNLIFLIIFSQDNQILGPTLTETPEILEDIEYQTQLDFVDAINLDGGSHSLFITDKTNIKEISKAGGFFCINNPF